MLPSIISHQTEEAIRTFLSHSFEMSSPLFSRTDEYGQYANAMEDFLNKKENLAKGPYISMSLPFRTSQLTRDYFKNLYLPFPPFQHQAKAYERLSAAEPKSTLVATGTGSGKTECFMNPVLDYCASEKGQGIKAIIIYPMNALATDQAKRFAKTISSNASLKNKVTVGLFVGQEDSEKTKVMSEDKVITCKDTLRENPPDILMTNYKMLDFLLLRPRDQVIWKNNKADTLRFLIVDELHTFDGAQGTDLSCLIRRLKHRLDIPADYLTCVGTSATVGNNYDELINYASDIFDAKFDITSVIYEDRLSSEEYLKDSKLTYFETPGNHDVPYYASYSDTSSYINDAILAWFKDESLLITKSAQSELGIEQRVELGEQIRKHRFFHRLLDKLNGEITSIESLCQDIFGSTRENLHYQLACLESFCALISTAKKAVDEDEEAIAYRVENGGLKPVLPLLQVRYQLWLRELRRMVASVSLQPEISFSDDLTQVGADTKYLPIMHCRDCHNTGWGGVIGNSETHINDDLALFYQLYFDRRPEANLIFPVKAFDDKLAKTGRYHKLCTNCLNLNSFDSAKSECSSCGHDELALVYLPDDSKRKNLTDGGSTLVAKHDCPFCNSETGLSVLGSRAASLISVLSHQLFGSSFNEDKQLITFSDSVQDAAHRAGFFTARTYPLLLRSLIARTIDKHHIKTIADLAEAVPHFARDLYSSDAAFVGTFAAPDMEWQSHFKELKETNKLPAKTNLPKNVKARLSWEAISEFGLKSHLGRSLVKSKFAATSFDRDVLDQAANQIHSTLIEEIAELSALEIKKVEAFLISFLNLLIINGAIVHPSLKNYILNAGDTYVHNKIGETSYYMPSWGRKSRKPRFLTVRKVSNSFDYLAKKSHGSSVYLTVLLKTLLSDDAAFATSYSETIFTRVLVHLKKAGILVSYEVKGEEVYGLNPDLILISRDINRIECSECGTPQNVDSGLADYWLGSPCLVPSCKGHFEMGGRSERNLSWNNFELVRINGFEHTGLLERDIREKVENSFIKGRDEWDINLLSATPTLEMGIDIGDLSSVALCSVPPAQSNYLQRIGRAGRRDGNAFNVTFSEGNAHDLYYYHEPLDMMSGAVQPPGVFLKANAVLERQLTAFCFDSWVKGGVSESEIPFSVRDLLNTVEGNHTHLFPYNFFDFISRNQGNLLEQFISLFESMDTELQASLSIFLRGNNDDHLSLSGRIINRVTQLVNDRKGLKKRVATIDGELRKLDKLSVKEADHSERVEQLTNERVAIRYLIRQINGKQTLNFFTDEGLLPNYAFPEEGVTIRSILWRKREQAESENDGGRFHKNTYNYERPAASALSELAPDNHFYAGGNKVEIEQVDLSVSTIETWRVCNNCSYSEDIHISGDKYKTCPKCGSVGWNDNGQLNQMLKLRQVYARTNERDAKISDDADNREPKFYKRQMLVSYEDSDIHAAYKIDAEDVVFGFDFVKKLTIKDVNFGVPDNQSEQSSVAGDEDYRTGFKVCNKCGMVKTSKSRSFKHDLTCAYNKTPEKALDEENFIDCLYLYRELSSEAVRILLPVSSYSANSANEATFAAAIQLGIKLYFKGSIDHIKSTVYSEPVNAGEGRRYYLVIYDTVPGGTGYLKSLMASPENLLDLVERSFRKLDSCSCNQDPSKDGCYKCIYAYRDRQRMPKISRDLAKSLFQKVLERRNDIVKVETLSSVNPNSLLDSELELKFIDTLKATGRPWKVSNAMVNGKNGYLLTVGRDGDVSHAWKIEPQVDLDNSKGVSVHSKPDFVFWPVKTREDTLPIAIFLDGYEFHNDKVAEDTKKRNAIFRSGKFLVWTLYWDDLDKLDSTHLKDYFELFQSSKLRSMFGNSLKQLTGKNYNQWNSVLKNKNNFQLLSELLIEPTSFLAALKQSAVVHSFCWLNPMKGMSSKNPEIAQKLEFELKENAPESRIQSFLDDPNYWFGGLMNCLDSSEQLVELTAAVSLTNFIKFKFNQSSDDCELLLKALKVHVCIDDTQNDDVHFKKSLIGYWKLYNVLQFLIDVSFCSKSMVELNAEVVVTPEPKLQGEASGDWVEVYEQTILTEGVHLLAELGNYIPEVGYELTVNEEIKGLAELAWVDHKVALFDDDDQDTIQQFINDDWQCYVAPVNDELIEKLKEKLGV